MTAPSMTASRSARSDEWGFTMIELMVSLTVLTIGVVGAIGVFNSSFSVAGQASIRSRAVSLATREIEAFRAIPYDRVVFTLAADSATESFGGITFTIQKAVTPADESTVTNAYKQATVSVSWTDHGGTHAVDQTTIVYPGGLGPHPDVPATTSATISVGVPFPPNPLTAAPPANTSDAETAVDLAWLVSDATNVSSFVLRYTTGGSVVVVTDTLPAVSRALRVTGLSAATAYTFQIASKSSTGALSGWVSSQSIITTAPPTAECTIGTPAIDPAQVARKSANEGGTLVVNPVFSVNTSGTCAGLRIEYQPSKHAAVVSRPLDGTSGLRTKSLEDAPVKWDGGSHFVDLYDGAGVKRATVKLLVCESAAKACR